MQSAELRPIPQCGPPGLLPAEQVCECGEAFVRLTDSDRFHIDLRYAAQGIRGAAAACYVRESVAEKLVSAQKMLPAGYRLRIFDAWRPFCVQQALYDGFAAAFTAEHPEITGEALRLAIRQFVSEPNRVRETSPVHCSGGAVDLTVERPDGTVLDMGTEFDCFAEPANTAWFEGSGNAEVIANRRLLFHIMTAAGFTNLPSEWWHFDCGDRFWGWYQGCACRYTAVFTEEEVRSRLAPAPSGTRR
ncbi:MAG: M15 family metallopeptidase [Oscillospiraceae bacterium]|nr:M15 family metallopeptidase [Oscillospiraceae bacterium]